MEENKPSAFSIIWSDIKKNRRLYYIVLPITFIVAAIIAFSIPNYYKCTVMLAPELNGAKSGGGLSGLASSFGINLGSANTGADAINPTLYPDLMNSVTFKASLFPVKVQRDGEDSTMTYYDYLKNHQRSPWWTSAKKTVFSLFAPPEPVEGPVDPFKLTPAQAAIIKVMDSKVECDVDEQTLVITIDVTDQDPLIAATMADSVQLHLQEFITDYRTRKARVDLEYNQKLFKETKARYEKARQLYSEFMDANQDVILQSVRQKQTDLENEMQLQYNAYTQVASQLLAAEAKVQQETPVFTLLQPATVPMSKSGPERKTKILLFMFVAFIAITLFVLYREKHIKIILSVLKPNPRQDMIEEEELYYLSQFLSNQKRNQKKE